MRILQLYNLVEQSLSIIVNLKMSCFLIREKIKAYDETNG